MIYAPSLSERLEATIAHRGAQDDEFYPEGLRGAANAYVVFVGPSYGAYNGTGDRFGGGADRPISKWSKRAIGGGLGLNPFPDGNRVRQDRWNRLLLACLDTPEAVQSLSALYNLDWGHHPDERSVPVAALDAGARVVSSYIVSARPRIIVPLSKLVWNHLIPALRECDGQIEKESVLPSHQSVLMKFPDRAGGNFEAIVARPYNHPSRHFLTLARITAFREELDPFKDGSAA